MKAVRVLAVADASALPGLRRALSPDAIELVGVASTPGSVLAQMLRVHPDVVVVDLSLSQNDVFQLITQLVQEHAVVLLALASGDEAASLAERAHAAGASDVVERRTTAGSWHEESGSPHVLSLRVLALAASARPRPSKLSLRVGRLPVRVSSPDPPLSAASLSGRALEPTAGVSGDAMSFVRASRPDPPLPAVSLSGRAPGSTPTTGISRDVMSAVRAAQSGPPLSAAELPGRAPGSPPRTSGAPRDAVISVQASQPVPPLSAAGMSRRAPGSPLLTTGTSREPMSSIRVSPPGLPREGSSSRRASPLAPQSAAAERSAPPAGAPQSAVESSRGLNISASPSALSRAPNAESPPSAARASRLPRPLEPRPGRPLTAAQVELVAIGASTGGTLALAELLKTLPESTPPMLVVQHMLPEFTNDFAQRLNELCELQVRVAVNGELVKPGTVLLAPGGRHLRVMRDAEQRLRARVTDELPVGKHRPSVDVLFQACAETLGSAAVGVLLTGMGDDGARGLLALHNHGARTLVQDQASSVCFGMPSAAIALGAAQQILPLRDIAHALRELVKTRGSARV